MTPPLVCPPPLAANPNSVQTNIAGVLKRYLINPEGDCGLERSSRRKAMASAIATASRFKPLPLAPPAI